MKGLQNVILHFTMLLGFLLLTGCEPESLLNDETVNIPAEAGGLVAVERDGNDYRVLYRSTDVNRESMLVSGTVIVPTAPWEGAGPRPLVVIAPGTHGGGDECAPSHQRQLGIDFETPFHEQFVDAGFVVAVTDYQGLGTPGRHTYTVAFPSAAALLDIARVAINLPATNLNANTPIVLSGYSQGGHASAKAVEIENTYAPELNIVGATAGGVPSNLISVGENLDGGLFAGFVGLTAIGMDTAYPELDLDSYLTAEGKTLIKKLESTCLIGTIANATLFKIGDETTSNPLETEQWQARLNEQRVGLVKPEVPVFLFHARLDPIIPYKLGTTLRDDWCARGAQVEWETYFAAEHMLAFFWSFNDVLDWATDRVNGVTMTADDCG